jgi:DNA repair protein RecN (Recombination protein N)
MLRELAVQNLALIEDVRIEMESGFIVWTGETGAGKSLLIGALGLLLGHRSSVDLIRSGEAELRVTGLFDLYRDELREEVEQVLESSITSKQIILHRRLSRNSGSRAYLDDQPISLSQLRRIGEVLIDLHGQRETNSLLEPEYQLRLLDSFGKLEGAYQEYLERADQLRKLRIRRAQLLEHNEARTRELTLIGYEREELSEAKLISGEKQKLEEERNRLTHAQGLHEFATRIAAELYDEDSSITVNLGRMVKEAESWARVDPSWRQFASDLQAVLPQFRELADQCHQRAERDLPDPKRLARVEMRLSILKKLEIKYRKSLEELITYRDRLNERESTISQEATDLLALEKSIHSAHEAWLKAGKSLSIGRARVAIKLAQLTQKQLSELGMSEAQLEARLDPLEVSRDPFESEIPPHGFEFFELLLAANPGEPAMPLRKVASGGELSRTLLALKSVLASFDPVGTLIFDEIDSNVGGRLGDVLGKKLAGLGRNRQVICVTHLPQVASCADSHWTIRKQTRGKRTSTKITPLLSQADRIEELALMMRGESRSEMTRQEAGSMLATSQPRLLV